MIDQIPVVEFVLILAVVLAVVVAVLLDLFQQKPVQQVTRQDGGLAERLDGATDEVL